VAVDRAGLRDRFRFTGWLPNDAMPDYYALADVVVMPSEREGQSCVYLEAQASGVALAASDIPATHSVVDDGRTGVLFRKGDPGDLADRVAALLADRPLRDRITERALRQVRASIAALKSYCAVSGSRPNLFGGPRRTLGMASA